MNLTAVILALSFITGAYFMFRGYLRKKEKNRVRDMLAKHKAESLKYMREIEKGMDDANKKRKEYEDAKRDANNNDITKH